MSISSKLPPGCGHPCRLVLDSDLAFAASCTAENRTNLRALRQHAVGAVRELKRRWAAVDSRLRRHQAPALRRVTAARDIGLIALLVVLFAWPDTALPFALIAGMPAVGFAPCYGVFPQIPVEQISFQEVMGDWRAHNARTLERLGPSKDDEFLLQQSTKDFESGFCSLDERRSAEATQRQTLPTYSEVRHYPVFGANRES